MKFVTIYRAADRVTADLIRGILEDEGIPVFIRPLQIPWMDELGTVIHGYWGEVQVPEEDAERGQKIIESYIENK